MHRSTRKKAQNEDDADDDFQDMYNTSEYNHGEEWIQTGTNGQGKGGGDSYVKFEESLSDGEGLEALLNKTVPSITLDEPYEAAGSLISDREGLEASTKRAKALGMLVVLELEPYKTTKHIFSHHTLSKAL